MNEVLKFLQEAGVFHIATLEGNQPRVRPFGFVMEFEGKVYFCTSNQKDFYKQLQANPGFEICAMHADGRWIRVSGKAVFDGNVEAKKKVLELDEGVRGIYQEATNPIFEVFYIAEGKATIYSFTAAPVEVSM